MSDLLASWERLRPRVAAAPRVCVLCDFDGTLSPLVPRPEDAVLPEGARRALAALAASPRVVAGVVSGRSLDDLRARLGMGGLWMVGNHGCESSSPEGRESRAYDERGLSRMEAVARELEVVAGLLPGTSVERKGPIVAFHYRRADPARLADVERAFLGVLALHRGELTTGRGHGVLEARLPGLGHKGTAVREIRRTLPAGALTFYFGDDVTDRDAFREIRPDGVSVEVGVGRSDYADYTLAGPEEVAEALRRLEAELRAPISSERRDAGPGRSPR